MMLVPLSSAAEGPLKCLELLAQQDTVTFWNTGIFNTTSVGPSGLGLFMFRCEWFGVWK